MNKRKKLALVGTIGVMSILSAIPAFAAEGWVKNNDKWYYYQNNTMLSNGFIQESGKYYYLMPDGSMVTGWLKIGNDYYYMRGDGSMSTGWREMNGNWYYLDRIPENVCLILPWKLTVTGISSNQTALC